MAHLSGGQILFYGGLAAMAVAVFAALFFASVFAFTGRKLKEKLEKEYGKMQ